MHSTEALIAAVRDTWESVSGTPLLPAAFRLLAVTDRHGRLELIVTGPAGNRYGYRSPLPLTFEATGESLEVEPRTPEQWVMWNLIVPLVEELETDPESRFLPDDTGMRWIEYEG